jgi:hypothetical protein
VGVPTMIMGEYVGLVACVSAGGIRSRGSFLCLEPVVKIGMWWAHSSMT